MLFYDFEAERKRINRQEHAPLKCVYFALQDAADRVEMDLRRAAKEGWVWGAKAVRGAYMHLERARANELGYECPVQECLQATHTNYNRRVISSLVETDMHATHIEEPV